MQLIPIKVACRPSHTGDQTPRRVEWEGGWLEVVEITDRWYEEGRLPEWPTADYFKVLASDVHGYLLKHERQSDEWFLARRW